jgi:glycosyltransferase involved in cell wall biosynthesis
VGLAGALAAAAREATGDLLARQDDDDISHPQRLEKQVAYLAAHPEVAVVGSATERIGPDGSALGAYPVPLEAAAIARALRRGPPFVHGSVLMRAAAYHEAGGYRAAFRAAQDYDLWLRFRPPAFANLPEPLYRWRSHPGGVFARARDEQLRFAALARAFAAERAQRGADSYDEFAAAGDWERFLERYPGRARLLRLMGETWVREGRVAEARRLLARALRSGAGAGALGWWLLSFGVALTPRAARARRAERAGAA